MARMAREIAQDIDRQVSAEASQNFLRSYIESKLRPYPIPKFVFPVLIDQLMREQCKW